MGWSKPKVLFKRAIFSALIFGFWVMRRSIGSPGMKPKLKKTIKERATMTSKVCENLLKTNAIIIGRYFATARQLSAFHVIGVLIPVGFQLAIFLLVTEGSTRQNRGKAGNSSLQISCSF